MHKLSEPQMRVRNAVSSKADEMKILRSGIAVKNAVELGKLHHMKIPVGWGDTGLLGIRASSKYLVLGVQHSARATGNVDARQKRRQLEMRVSGKYWGRVYGNTGR